LPLAEVVVADVALGVDEDSAGQYWLPKASQIR
jgi:hypothetical protein